MTASGNIGVIYDFIVALESRLLLGNFLRGPTNYRIALVLYRS